MALSTAQNRQPSDPTAWEDGTLSRAALNAR